MELQKLIQKAISTKGQEEWDFFLLQNKGLQNTPYFEEMVRLFIIRGTGGPAPKNLTKKAVADFATRHNLEFATIENTGFGRYYLYYGCNNVLDFYFTLEEVVRAIIQSSRVEE